MRIITTKGHILGLEAFLVFIAWMLILALVWSDSTNTMHSSASEWKRLRALETSIALSDALILSHHVQPWKGCAVFDGALQRTRSYVIYESCLQSLSHQLPPTPRIARVSLHRISNDVNYFSRSVDVNETCVNIRRPVFLFPTMENTWVEVLSCA